MSIASATFFVLFLPVCFTIYWLLLKKDSQKLWFLLAISYLFYALADIRFLPLLIGLSALTFWLAQRRRFVIGIILNLLVLAIFKYGNLGTSNASVLTDLLKMPFLLPLFSFALPLGISFYVFKHIGYLLDIRQNRYEASKDFLAFATFSAFFPQIGAGPISSFKDTGSQLRALPATLTATKFYEGAVFITVGLSKKILIADRLNAAMQTQLFPVPQHTGLVWTWYSVIIFAMQLYFDFSGYTDIALGIATLFGVRLPENFNSPYLAANPTEFWQRWHISLSSWFRVYLFTPLSRLLIKRLGSQRAALAQYVSNLITMVLIGLWHGSAWPFIVWGAYHGFLLNINAWLNRRRIHLPIPYLGRLLFLLTVLVGWAIFLSPSLSYVQNLLGSLLGGTGLGQISDVWMYEPLVLLVTAVALITAFSGFSEAAAIGRIRSPVIGVTLGLLAALCILQMGTLVQFAYVQF